MFARACPPSRMHYLQPKKDKKIEYSETGSLCIIYMALSSLALYSCSRTKFIFLCTLSLPSTITFCLCLSISTKGYEYQQSTSFCTSLISFYAGNLNKNVQRKKKKTSWISFLLIFLTNLFDV